MLDMVKYAQMFMGTKYTWGGNTPEEGFDCSGFIIEVLRSSIIIPHDMTAQQLMYYLIDDLGADQIVGKENFDVEDIIFYGKNMSNISHVSMYLGKRRIIEAGGEGRVQTNKGFVRIRPLDYRDHDIVCAARIY